MKVSTLLEGLKYICCQGSTEQEVSTVVYDSRKVEENSLFICICGCRWTQICTGCDQERCENTRC